MIHSKMSRLFIILTGILLLSGCNANPNANEDNGRNMNGNRLNANDVRQYGYNLRNTDIDRMPPRNTNRVHNNSRIEVSQEMADQIASMKEVDSANVLVTDENVYVAVVLENGTTTRNGNQTNMNRVTNMNDDVPAALKHKIANKVQSLKPDADNVYVSANPDFIDRINGFVDQVQEGRPVQGFINEFNTMVARMFPMNASDNN